ncbi:hypothetical protein TNCV_4152061 [Trichonephila clavipes]|nr:hypothetical protein TNCV_4152061 [Trichonephila clavipes]
MTYVSSLVFGYTTVAERLCCNVKGSRNNAIHAAPEVVVLSARILVLHPSPDSRSMMQLYDPIRQTKQHVCPPLS